MPTRRAPLYPGIGGRVAPMCMRKDGGDRGGILSSRSQSTQSDAGQGQGGQFANIYSLDELNEFGPFLDDVYTAAEECGIGHDALKIADDDFLQADPAQCGQAARLSGLFHGKALPHACRQRAACAFSMLDQAGRNVYDDGTERGSDLMLNSLAGLMDSMADITLVFAPHLHSYRRLSPSALR